MPRSYCTVQDVKEYLPPNVVSEGTNPFPNPRNPAPETLTVATVNFYIQQACGHIDAALGSIYDVPLAKTNMGGDIKYPDPISEMAAVMAAALIFEQRLQGADRQRSELVEQRVKEFKADLNAIKNGEVVLWGQRRTRGSRFVRNTLYNAPLNPAEGGRSKSEG